jgi:adenylosuccinate synthase
MPLEIIVGAQWGDEGKGRVVDLLSAKATIVARYNGGDNAGHTVTAGAQTFKLHLVPSGVIHPHTIGVLGNGMVINPATLLQEMQTLRAAGVDLTPERLRISHVAHLITPAHRALDAAQERARGQGQIGTTGRGIGPAYTDKASRRGLRLEDMLKPDSFAEKLAAHTTEVNTLLEKVYAAAPLDVAAVVAEYSAYARTLTPYIDEISALVSQALSEGKVVLAEGAQGTLLDLDLGTYPFVTSSTPTAPGALTGLGLGLCPVSRVIGVTKVFQTRVGSGPFPTEVSGAAAERLRGTGSNPWDEFGTTTGRPRRVGWLDGVLLRYAVRVNGLSELILTKLDVLGGLPSINICTAYHSGGKRYTDLPLGPADLSPFEPEYEDLPGWEEDLRAVRAWDDLPAAAQNYIRRIEALTGAPVRMVSVGPERDQVIAIK